MVSYKQMYEELKRNIEEMNKPHESDYKCPLCEEVILESQSEYYCSNENCKFDKTSGDLFNYYAESNRLERND